MQVRFDAHMAAAWNRNMVAHDAKVQAKTCQRLAHMDLNILTSPFQCIYSVCQFQLQPKKQLLAMTLKCQRPL